MRLLVYGTIMGCWPKAQKCVVTNCRLFDIGHEFPGLIIGEGESSVECEIIDVSEDEMMAIDHYEGVSERYFIREKYKNDIEYYRPSGALSPLYHKMIHEVLHDGNINWLAYRIKGEDKGYSVKNVTREELARLYKDG